MITSDRRKLGKQSRAAGKRFEIKVREDLEKTGWIVVRWDKNVELIKSPNEKGEMLIIPEESKLVQSKPKFNPFTKSIMMNSSGFPDFICIKHFDLGKGTSHLDVRFIECKLGKYLDKIEKEKVRWIKENLKIPVIVASRGLKRGEIKYEEI